MFRNLILGFVLLATFGLNAAENWKSWNGVAKANIKSFIGVAEANIKSWNGVANVGSSWTPTNETVLAWWDSTLTPQSEDSAVNLWIPRFGPNLQGPVSVAPTYKNSIKNSLGVVRFGGGANLNTTNQNNAIKPITVAAVLLADTTVTGLILGSATAGGFSLDIDSGSFRILDQNEALIGTCPVTADTWYALVVTYDGSGNYAWFTNGVAGPTGTANHTFTGGQIRVGIETGAGGSPFTGDIGDLIVDDVVWDSTQYGNFFTWANAKWSLGF